MRGYDDISRLVIHDNAIDFGYIAQVETDARSHAPLAIEKVAAAHYAAAQFLESKGDTASAIDHYREALSFAPDNLALLLNLAVLYLHQSQFTSALEPLERARRMAPDSPGRRQAHRLGLLRREQNGFGGGRMASRGKIASRMRT